MECNITIFKYINDNRSGHVYAALTTVLPVLFKCCYKYCYSDGRKLWAVMKGGGLAHSNLIQPTIFLEMPVSSQGHYGFHSFPCIDWFCLFIYLWVLTFPLLDCSEFGNLLLPLISMFEITMNVYTCVTDNTTYTMVFVRSVCVI